MSKQNKVRPHNKVAQVLLHGEPVSPEEIRLHFEANDPTMIPLLYRLSIYIYDIRKYDSGIIRVVKDKRKVTSYQLTNADLFDMNGCFTGISRVAIANAEVDSWENEGGHRGAPEGGTEDAVSVAPEAEEPPATLETGTVPLDDSDSEAPVPEPDDDDEEQVEVPSDWVPPMIDPAQMPVYADAAD